MSTRVRDYLWKGHPAHFTMWKVGGQGGTQSTQDPEEALKSLAEKTLALHELKAPREPEKKLSKTAAKNKARRSKKKKPQAAMVPDTVASNPYLGVAISDTEYRLDTTAGRFGFDWTEDQVTPQDLELTKLYAMTDQMHADAYNNFIEQLEAHPDMFECKADSKSRAAPSTATTTAADDSWKSVDVMTGGVVLNLGKIAEMQRVEAKRIGLDPKPPATPSPAIKPVHVAVEPAEHKAPKVVETKEDKARDGADNKEEKEEKQSSQGMRRAFETTHVRAGPAGMLVRSMPYESFLELEAACNLLVPKQGLWLEFMPHVGNIHRPLYPKQQRLFCASCQTLYESMMFSEMYSAEKFRLVLKCIEFVHTAAECHDEVLVNDLYHWVLEKSKIMTDARRKYAWGAAMVILAYQPPEAIWQACRTAKDKAKALIVHYCTHPKVSLDDVWFVTVHHDLVLDTLSALC